MKGGKEDGVVAGIGSLYYLSYALSHGGSGQAAADATGLTVSVVALSVLVHGVTAQPVLTRYERALSSARAERNTGTSQL